MAIKFQTKSPNLLLSTFKKAIDEGKVSTWSYDQDGDFTHTADQWNNRAWLRPKVRGEELIFRILKPKNSTISKIVYGVYHGRFVESMLFHCDSMFTDVVVTALPAEGDIVS